MDTHPSPAPRRCPSGCGTLASFSFRGIALDRCQDCAGVWFDAREYQKLNDLPDAALRALDDHVQPAHTVSAERARPCPECAALMRPLTFRAGVTLDQCALCGGLWADDGELATLAHAVRDKPYLTFADSVRPDTSYTIGLATTEYLSEQQEHRLSLFQTVCAWVQRPRLSGV